MSSTRYMSVGMLCVLAGCGGAEPIVASSREPAAPAAPLEVPLKAGDYSASWSSRFDGWNEGVLVAASGEVLTFASRTLRIHDPADGHVLRTAETCLALDQGSIAFADPTRLVVGCSDGVIVLSWPSLARQKSPRMNLRTLAIASDRIAAVDASLRRVRVHALDDFRLVAWFDLPSEGRSIAIAPDGNNIAVGCEGGMFAYDVAARTGRVVYPTDSMLHAMAFSPDGRRLLVGIGSRPVELDAASYGALRFFEDQSSLSAVRYLSPDLIAATGSNGLALFAGPGGTRAARILDPKLDHGLGASASGLFLCAGGSSGELGCFQTHAAAPVRWAAVPIAPLPVSPPPAESPMPERPRPPRPTAPAGFVLRWATKLPWAGDIAVAPSGEVVSLSASEIRVHAAKDGSIVRTGTACPVEHTAGFGFAKPDRLITACEHEIRALTWPDLAPRPSFRLPNDLDVAAVGGGCVAVDVEDTPHVRVYAVDGWRTVDDFATPGIVALLALASDGKRLAFTVQKSDGLYLRDLVAKKTTALFPQYRRGFALTFSPDGKRIFADAQSSHPLEIDVATGGQLRMWKNFGWLNAARYLTKDVVVAAGHEGIALFAGAGGDEPVIVPPYDRAVATAGDGSLFCASGARGDLACFVPAP